MIKDYAYNKLKDVKGVVRNCKSWNRQKVTKIKRTNIQIMINKTLHRKKKLSNMKPIIIRGGTHVLPTVKQFRLH